MCFCRAVFLIVWTAVFSLSGFGCRQEDNANSQRNALMPTKTIEQVQQEHTDEWMAIPGVVGTAIGQDEGRPCILILTASGTENVRKKIPPRVDGYAVIVRYSGEIRALDKQ
jgi:hypothetical protein